MNKHKSLRRFNSAVDISVVPPSSGIRWSGPSNFKSDSLRGTLITDIEFRIGGANNVTVAFDAGLGFTRVGNVRVNDPSDANKLIYGTAPNVVNRTTYNFEITTVNQCNPGTNEISLAGTITILPEETIIHGCQGQQRR